MIISGNIEVVKSLDPSTHDQAETVLTYTCNTQNWAFSYPYDETQPSFAFTNNVDNITITCNYSGNSIDLDSDFILEIKMDWSQKAKHFIIF